MIYHFCANLYSVCLVIKAFDFVVDIVDDLNVAASWSPGDINSEHKI